MPALLELDVASFAELDTDASPLLPGDEDAELAARPGPPALAPVAMIAGRTAIGPTTRAAIAIVRTERRRAQARKSELTIALHPHTEGGGGLTIHSPCRLVTDSGLGTDRHVPPAQSPAPEMYLRTGDE